MANTSRQVDVGLRSIVFTDSSRTTLNYTSGKTEPGRTIGVEIRYPTDRGSPAHENLNAPLSRRAHYPLIVLAPGYRLQPENYAALLDAWVRDGFIVAALEFPDTTYPESEPPYAAGLPHGSPESDVFNEPADVAFAIRRLVSTAATKKSWLHGLIDEGAIVLAGHSDGGEVVAALVYDKSVDVPRVQVRAVAVLSGGEFPIANQSYSQPENATVPLLVIQSATDLCNPPWRAVQLYDAVGAPKDFVELDNATHLGSYDGSQHQAFSVVASETEAFFDRALGTSRVTPAQLSAAGSVPGVASFTSASIAPDIPTPPGTSSCPAD